MQLTSVLAAVLAGASGLAAAQGGFIYAVEKLYQSGGCTQFVRSQPIFGGANICQPLPSDVNVVSANTTSVAEGCTGKSPAPSI